mmetsp:Transcript_49377/g.136862  ORF Transcript_49377/g.136862 Transcript_49377/m.136862 type:complete len:244 (-) Transcript_49377:367-1098(-)
MASVSSRTCCTQPGAPGATATGIHETNLAHTSEKAMPSSSIAKPCCKLCSRSAAALSSMRSSWCTYKSCRTCSSNSNSPVSGSSLTKRSQTSRRSWPFVELAFPWVFLNESPSSFAESNCSTRHMTNLASFMSKIAMIRPTYNCESFSTSKLQGRGGIEDKFLHQAPNCSDVSRQLQGCTLHGVYSCLLSKASCWACFASDSRCFATFSSSKAACKRCSSSATCRRTTVASARATLSSSASLS